MAKRGIKIKDLAQELGVTSRQLVDRCREEGVQVQNSITKVPPDVERRVRAWYEPGGDAVAGAHNADGDDPKPPGRP